MKPPMGIKADDQTLLEWICETEKYQSPKFNPEVVTAGFVQQALPYPKPKPNPKPKPKPKPNPNPKPYLPMAILRFNN